MYRRSFQKHFSDLKWSLAREWKSSMRRLLLINTSASPQLLLPLFGGIGGPILQNLVCCKLRQSSVTRWWNKKLPNFSQYCPKSSQIILNMKVALFKIAPKIYHNIWATFEGKLVIKKFKKSPNLATLLMSRSRFVSVHLRVTLLRSGVHRPDYLLPDANHHHSRHDLNVMWATGTSANDIWPVKANSRVHILIGINVRRIRSDMTGALKLHYKPYLTFPC